MRNKLGTGVRLVAALFIGLVVLELCARTEDKIVSQAPFFGNYSIDNLYGVDALGKYGLPNASYLKWHLNEAGYRGPPLRSGTYRIVCIGSSETFGLYESPEHEWPRELEGLLNRHTASSPFEVVNVAYPGMSVRSSIKRLPNVLAALKPHMAIIYPSYTSYIEDGAIEPPAMAEAGDATPRVPKPVNAGFQLRIAGRINTLMKASIPQVVQHKMRALQITRDMRGRRAMERLPEEDVEAFRVDLDRLTTQLQEGGVKVILVTHANRFGKKLDPADLPVLSDWRKFYPTLEEQGFLDMERRMSEAVVQVGQAHGISVVDAASEIPPGANFFAEFVHFTDFGSHALASLVADEVLRQRVVP